MKVYFAADHAGFEMKNGLLAYVRDELRCETEDCGAFSLDESDDYPGIIANAARKLSDDAAAGKESFAIVGGASGQGEAMVANRFRGVRCALFYGGAAKRQTDMSGNSLGIVAGMRAHNNANALSLGFRFLSLDEAKNAVREFLSTPFSNEERHARRVKQVDELA